MQPARFPWTDYAFGESYELLARDDLGKEFFELSVALVLCGEFFLAMACLAGICDVDAAGDS